MAKDGFFRRFKRPVTSEDDLPVYVAKDLDALSRAIKRAVIADNDAGLTARCWACGGPADLGFFCLDPDCPGYNEVEVE